MPFSASQFTANQINVLSLDEITSNKDLLAHFTEYCEKESNGENIQFFTDKETDYKIIYKKYFSGDAPRKINIASRTDAAAKKAYDAGGVGFQAVRNDAIKELTKLLNTDVLMRYRKILNAEREKLTPTSPIKGGGLSEAQTNSVKIAKAKTLLQMVNGLTVQLGKFIKDELGGALKSKVKPDIEKLRKSKDALHKYFESINITEFRGDDLPEIKALRAAHAKVDSLDVEAEKAFKKVEVSFSAGSQSVSSPIQKTSKDKEADENARKAFLINIKKINDLVEAFLVQEIKPFLKGGGKNDESVRAVDLKKLNNTHVAFVATLDKFKAGAGNNQYQTELKDATGKLAQVKEKLGELKIRQDELIKMAATVRQAADANAARVAKNTSDAAKNAANAAAAKKTAEAEAKAKADATSKMVALKVKEAADANAKRLGYIDEKKERQAWVMKWIQVKIGATTILDDFKNSKKKLSKDQIVSLLNVPYSDASKDLLKAYEVNGQKDRFKNEVEKFLLKNGWKNWDGDL